MTASSDATSGAELLSAIATAIGVPIKAVKLQEELTDGSGIPFTVESSATPDQISAKIQEMMPDVTLMVGEPTAVVLTEEQAAAALQMAANGVADGDVTAATAWLQEKLREGGVDGLQTAVLQVTSE